MPAIVVSSASKLQPVTPRIDKTAVLDKKRAHETYDLYNDKQKWTPSLVSPTTESAAPISQTPKNRVKSLKKPFVSVQGLSSPKQTNELREPKRMDTKRFLECL